MAVMRKKICVLVSNDISTDQRMDRICSSLKSMGFELEIIGRKLPNSLALVQKGYQQNRLKLIFNQGPLFYAEINLRQLFYLLINKPDFVYSVDADTALAGVWSKFFLKNILIFDAHELFSEVPELQNRKTIKSIWRRIEKLIILNADYRITVSESIANYFFNLYGKRFGVIRNMAIPKTIQVKTNSEKYILYQGALNLGRGLEQLIEASKSLDIKIKIAGDGDLKKKLTNLAKFNKKIEFLGKLLPDELAEITANAWLGYNLLDNLSLSYYYSLSNKTFDYIQAGIPQLMPDFPEYLNLNNAWGFGICINLNADEIVKVVKQLITEENLYKNLEGNAVKAATVLTWENESHALAKVFEAVL